ncbi:unnamed protein product [Closterium sp. NIES-54]
MIISTTNSTPDRLQARLAHDNVDTIKSSAKHEVATGLDITSSTGIDPPCVSCVGGKLARHTFPDQGSNAEEALAVVHIDLCGPFRVAAKDGSLYFLLLKDRHIRFVWVMPVAKKSDVLREFEKWLVLVERQAKKPVLMLRSDWGGEFLGKEFTAFVDGKGIVHDLTCPYTPQQNGMAEWEMRTAVESVRTMLLHMGVQHHWWHLALRQAVWVRNCLERSKTPPGTTPFQLLTGKKPDLTLAWVWGCMVQFMVPEQQRGGKLAPKARWGLHLGVSPASKGMGGARPDRRQGGHVGRGWTQAHPPTDTTTTTVTLLTKVDEPADEDVVEVLPPPPVLVPPSPVADRPASTPVSATGDEGSLEALPVAPASSIAGDRQGAKLVDQDEKLSTAGEHQTGEPVEQEASLGVQSTGELTKLAEDLAVDEEGELSAGEDSTDSDVVEVPITKPDLRRTGRARRPLVRLSFHTCLPPAAFTTVYDEVNDDLLYDDAKEDEKLRELDPDVYANPEHRWDITTMTVKEALASWKGGAVKAAMEDEIRSLVGMGTWELVERPRGVNIKKNRWVLTTKYRIDDTVEREKARLVVKGFTQVFGADYNETYSPASSYVTLKIFLSIAAVLDLNLMQLDMKNAFLHSKLDMVLYMYQPNYFDDGTGQVCKLLKSLYGLKKSPLLWYRALDGVLLGAKLVAEGWLAAVRGDDDEAGHRVCLQQAGKRSHESLELIGYVDADDAGDKQNRTSTGGYVFVYGGAAVSWSRRIKCATLSSTESEYVAATDAGKERRRLRFLLAEFKLLDAGKPTILRVDNKSAITAAEGLGLAGNLKHMERRYAWLQHMVRRGKFVLKYIPTTEQPADFLTKALHFPAFNRCFVAIGQVPLADIGDGDDDAQQ